MKAVLVRVAIDAAYGKWNGPIDSDTNEFVYVPIPENCQFLSGFETGYLSLENDLRNFVVQRNLDLMRDCRFPKVLWGQNTHHDPDFRYLTYGDVGSRRGRPINNLSRGDLVVFYAGLRDYGKPQNPMTYGLIGMLTVEEVVSVGDISRDRWHENAHTRRSNHVKSDVVVRGQLGESGEFRKAIPIGEYRDRAYRVRQDLLDAWGDLTVKNGYIQRSANLPSFRNPKKFKNWLDHYGYEFA